MIKFPSLWSIRVSPIAAWHSAAWKQDNGVAEREQVKQAKADPCMLIASPTFDAGVIIAGQDGRCRCLWFQDEDCTKTYRRACRHATDAYAGSTRNTCSTIRARRPQRETCGSRIPSLGPFVPCLLQQRASWCSSCRQAFWHTPLTPRHCFPRRTIPRAEYRRFFGMRSAFNLKMTVR